MLTDDELGLFVYLSEKECSNSTQNKDGRQLIKRGNDAKMRCSPIFTRGYDESDKRIRKKEI